MLTLSIKSEEISVVDENPDLKASKERAIFKHRTCVATSSGVRCF